MDASGNVQGLKAALEGVGELRVADYQRDYSWGPEEIDQLWADIESLLDEGGPEEHFLGTLILQKDRESSNRFELVDGQQRLTTIFLFMSALLDQANYHESRTLKISGRTFNVAQEIENFILGEPESGSSTTSSSSRLIPLVFLQKTFSKITDISLTREKRKEQVPRKAQKGDKSSAITLPLRRAYNHIDTKVDEHLQGYKRGSEEHLARVNEVRDLFMKSLKVMTLHTEDLQDSLSVFMTLNNRGTPLGVFDLFRGEVLKTRLEKMPREARDDLFQQSLDEWKSIMENLGNYSADKYLRHFALVKNVGKEGKPEPLTMKKLPSWTSEYIKASPQPVMAAERIWEEAYLMSDDYGYFLRPTGQDFTDYYLEAMKLIGESYRVLLIGVDPRNETVWKPKERESLYELCFRLMVKWPLSGGNAQVLEGKFQNLAQGFKGQDDVRRLLKDLKTEGDLKFDLKARLESDAPLDDAMSKALLLVLEGHLSRHSVKINLQEVQLEHIAPQTATAEWESILGSDYQELVSSLGNLIVLDNKINSKIKQAPFSEKITEYKKSRLNTVKDLVAIPLWDASVIEKRKKWLAAQIAEIIEGTGEPRQFSESV